MRALLFASLAVTAALPFALPFATGCTKPPLSSINDGGALVDDDAGLPGEGEGASAGEGEGAGGVDAGSAQPDAGFAGGAACSECVTASDCASNASCVQIGSTDVCATKCTSDADCASDEVCFATHDSGGPATNVCAKKSGSCDASGGCGTCPSGTTCDIGSGECVTPPSAPPPGGAGPVGPVGGSVDNNGGTVSGLYFAVVGDTRPGQFDNNDDYPTAIINNIYATIESLSPRPEFVLGTGDYMYAQKDGPNGAIQIGKYTQAAAQFQGKLFAAMGNHECASITSINCAGLLGSPTANMNAYMDALVAPLGKDKPYYTLHFAAQDASWTAKIIVTACNAWDHDQRVFLQDALGEDTTYTIVARHEPRTTLYAPCIAEQDVLLALHPPDVLLVGHTHTFQRHGTEVIVGNGGAPLSSSVPYGFATVELVPGQGFRVVQYDAETGAAVDAFVIGP